MSALAFYGCVLAFLSIAALVLVFAFRRFFRLIDEAHQIGAGDRREGRGE